LVHFLTKALHGGRGTMSRDESAGTFLSRGEMKREDHAISRQGNKGFSAIASDKAASSFYQGLGGFGNVPRAPDGFLKGGTK